MLRLPCAAPQDPSKKQKEDPTFDMVGYWQGMIIGIQNKPCGEVLYQWICKIPRNYPESPPIVRTVPAPT